MLEEESWEGGVWTGLVRHLGPFLPLPHFLCVCVWGWIQKLMVCHVARAIGEEPNFLQICPYSPGFWEGQGTGRSHL